MKPLAIVSHSALQTTTAETTTKALTRLTQLSAAQSFGEPRKKSELETPENILFFVLLVFLWLLFFNSFPNFNKKLKPRSHAPTKLAYLLIYLSHFLCILAASLNTELKLASPKLFS